MKITPAKACFLLIMAVMCLIWVRGAYGQAVAHTAAWTINTSSCTTTAPCTAQIYRAIITSGNCPAAGNSAYAQIQSALPATFPDATQTTWQYTDSGTALTSGSTYCGYSTVTFTAGGGPTGPSAIFQGPIPTPLNPPANPPGIAVTLK